MKIKVLRSLMLVATALLLQNCSILFQNVGRDMGVDHFDCVG